MASMEKLQIGLKALLEAAAGLPLGSEVQGEVMEAVKKIGKHLPQGGQGGDPTAMVQQLAALAQAAKTQPQGAGLAGLMGGGGGGAPSMPPPGAGAPPPPMPAGGP